MILGTAGHVDHGKTALVKALTGVDTDRLPEEKRRGMTLELGFAHLSFPDGLTLGVIDVPGHERFVKAMAAGAGGVDVALLVVAADEGVMPQTREHIDICTLLGVKRGLVVISKGDLLGGLGADWEAMLATDVREAVRGSCFEDAELMQVSARTGEGIEALKHRIHQLAKQAGQPASEGPLFLPVDRAFSIKGFGCVVTGTLRSGTLALTDEVSLLPAHPQELRVRGLQVHGQAVESARAGTRVAVNLQGVDAEAVQRGCVLTRASELPVCRALDVSLTVLPSVEKSIPRRSRQLVVLGTQQLECVVSLVDATEVRPGESALAQLRFGSPLAAMPGQRFVMRGTHQQPNRGATLGGGRVLTLNPPRRRKGAAERLQQFAEADGPTRVLWLLETAGYEGLSSEDLFARASLGEKELEKTLAGLLAKNQVMLVEKEPRRFLARAVFSGMCARAHARLESFHAENPERSGISREELRQRLGIEREKTFARVVTALLEAGVEANGEQLNLAGRGKAFDSASASLKTQLRSMFATAALAPPTLTEIETRLNAPQARLVTLLNALVEEGHLVKAKDLYFDATAVHALGEKVTQHLAQHPELTTQQFKDFTGQSRKFVIPLAEYFDAQKLTLRVGEVRILRKKGRTS